MHLFLLPIQFTLSTADPCNLHQERGGSTTVLLQYVDDIFLTGSDKENFLEVIELLKDMFETVDLGDANFLLQQAWGSIKMIAKERFS